MTRYQTIKKHQFSEPNTHNVYCTYAVHNHVHSPALKGEQTGLIPRVLHFTGPTRIFKLI